MIDAELKTCMLESLSGAALDLVQPCILDRLTTAWDVFRLLDTMYGKVESSHELVIRFHECIQGPREAASDFLQRLFLRLTEAIQGGGIVSQCQDLYLTKQFLRGCRDENLLAKLGLNEHQPQSFQQLLKMIRVQESIKLERQAHFDKSGICASISSDTSELKALKEQVKSLERQLSSERNKTHAMPRGPSGSESCFHHSFLASKTCPMISFSRSYHHGFPINMLQSRWNIYIRNLNLSSNLLYPDLRSSMVSATSAEKMVIHNGTAEQGKPTYP